MNSLNQKKMLTITFLCFLLGSCNIVEEVPDYNNPSLEEITESPTAASVNALATGVLIGAREQPEDYIYVTGIVGREMYDFDVATLSTSQLILGPLDPGQWGGLGWESQYQNVRNVKLLLSALERVENMTDEEKEGIRGYAKTIEAYELLTVINTRDTNGAVIDLPADPTGEPGPLVGKDQVFTRIDELLEEANTHLQNSGNSFSFNLSSGFSDFDSPATFLAFNRALKARVAIYQGNYEDALTALGNSFLDLTASLDAGAYHIYSTSSGSATNPFSSRSQGDAPSYVAKDSYETDAQSKANGNPDDRYQEKFRKLPSVQSRLGLQTDITFTIYNTPEKSIPIIRNEELILLRAEANLNLGNISQAAADINFIRKESGGLENRKDLNGDNILDELLYNKRYSLYMEGGHRWIDLRRYSMLDRIVLSNPDAVIFEKFPIPLNECLGRGLEAPCSAE
jgi:hypothetical protein